MGNGEGALMRWGEVVEYLGISDYAMRKLVRSGELGEVRLRDEQGRPQGRAWYRRGAVEGLAKMRGE